MVRPTEKQQPWKAAWLQRNAQDRTTKTQALGTTHGFSKGQEIILDGFTSGVAIGVKAKEDEQK